MDTQPQANVDTHEPDDLDRLMTRLESPVAPPTLVSAILAETVGRQPAAVAARQRARVALWAVYGASLALVLVAAVLLGQALHATGTLDFLAFALHDWNLARSNPGLFGSALGEHMPWGNAIVLLIALMVWLATTVALLRRPAAPTAPRGPMTRTAPEGV